MDKKTLATLLFLPLLAGTVGFVVHVSSVGIRVANVNVEGYAVILEMNEFPEGWTDLPVDFMNSKMMRDVLVELGWKDENIVVIQDNLTISTVQSAVNWLANVAKTNDVALLYIFTHGGWMRNELLWNEWFPDLWAKLDTSRRILMVDTCSAEEFIVPVYGDPAPHISLAHCSAEEAAWAGTEEEGLPIIGTVWNYYFTSALLNSTADLDENGFVSVEEAFDFSTPLVQKYMNESVFTVPEFLEMYHEVGIYPEDYNVYPHPVIDDQYLEQLHLDLQYYRLIGDLNFDGAVDIHDIVHIGLAFGSVPAEPHWNPVADVNSDGAVDIFDVVAVAKDFGKTI